MTTAATAPARVRLSPHFTLGEMTKSQTALNRGIPNVPNAQQTEALRFLCTTILEPIRAHFGAPVIVSSGFRSTRLNRAIGGSQDSQHRLGEAADIQVVGVDNLELAQWIRANLPFDQLILEQYTRGDPHSGWVHVSATRRQMRKSVLTKIKGVPGYPAGLIA